MLSPVHRVCMSAQLLLKVKCMLSAALLADHALDDMIKEVSVADSQATALQIYSQSDDVVLTAQREANVQKNRKWEVLCACWASCVQFVLLTEKYGLHTNQGGKCWKFLNLL